MYPDSSLALLRSVENLNSAVGRWNRPQDFLWNFRNPKITCLKNRRRKMYLKKCNGLSPALSLEKLNCGEVGAASAVDGRPTCQTFAQHPARPQPVMCAVICLLSSVSLPSVWSCLSAAVCQSAVYRHLSHPVCLLSSVCLLSTTAICLLSPICCHLYNVICLLTSVFWCLSAVISQSAVCRHLSDAVCLPSSVCHISTAICLLTPICCHLYGTNCLLSPVSCGMSAVICLSAVI